MSNASGFTDWPELIGESVLLRQRMNELDPEISPYTIPKVGASPEQLHAAEVRMGAPLDALHRELLTYANGWEFFFQFTHLLSTEELGTSPRWHKADEMLDVFYSDGPPPQSFGMPARDEVLCVSADPDEVLDLFVIWRTGPLTDGGRPVSWVAGEEVQRFANMHELMLSVNEYTRRKLVRTLQS
jgi:hypothetical protein